MTYRRYFKNPEDYENLLLALQEYEETGEKQEYIAEKYDIPFKTFNREYNKKKKEDRINIKLNLNKKKNKKKVYYDSETNDEYYSETDDKTESVKREKSKPREKTRQREKSRVNSRKSEKKSVRIPPPKKIVDVEPKAKTDFSTLLTRKNERGNYEFDPTQLLTNRKKLN